MDAADEQRAKRLSLLEELERRRRIRRASRVSMDEVKAKQREWRERLAALWGARPIHPEER